MSLQMPTFDSELQEADWWYDNRELVEAEMLLSAAEGRLQRRSVLGEPVSVPALCVPVDELKRARELLERSGIRVDDSCAVESAQLDPSEKYLKAS